MGVDEVSLWVAWERHVSADRRAFERLTARYREPHRQYHDLGHVGWVVRHLAAFERAGLLSDPAATFAAALFHDAVYDPTAPGSEAASARLATSELSALGWPDERTARVAELIGATVDHPVETGDADIAALVAADLAVLAAEPERYADYTRSIRREYGHLDDTTWRAGRRRVVTAFLARDHIFPLGLDLAGWEERARANLTAELALLGPPRSAT